MADVNLKKLSRAELLEMMINFSEETEAAKRHESELTESFEKERLQLQREMAEERARMLKNFDEEKAQMRAKFQEQKAEMQAKFDKDIAGLKARLAREKAELQTKVDDSLIKIENSQSLAEASLMVGGVMEAAQKAADLYVETLKKSATEEYQKLIQEIESHRKRMALLEKQAEDKVKTKEAVNKEDKENRSPEKVEDKAKEKKTTRKRTTKKVTEETNE